MATTESGTDILIEADELNFQDSAGLVAGDEMPEIGLVAFGGDLKPERLIAAYRVGIFPWYNNDPILWWSPDPRCVLFPQKFRPSRSLRKSIRKNGYRFTLDRAFGEVIRHCARPHLGPDETWINSDMIDAYSEMHRRGYAHSVETWQGRRLVGGLYGIAMGRVFFGESMFSTETDASKGALVYLVDRLLEFGYMLIDCQVTSAHLLSIGAEEIPREAFMRILGREVGKDGIPGFWAPDRDAGGGES